MLGSIEQQKLEAAAKDDAFLAHLRRVDRTCRPTWIHEGTWFHKTWAKRPRRTAHRLLLRRVRDSPNVSRSSPAAWAFSPAII